MKVTFVSNYLTHHQIPFSNSMYRILEGNLWFVSTQPMSSERKDLGWQVTEHYPYEVQSYRSEAMKRKALQLVNESDVAIIGSAPDFFMTTRLRNRKLTFRYSERFYKQKLTLRKIPRALISAYLHHGRFQKYPIYMLCASAYTAADALLFGNYRERVFKWGYFPECRHHNIEELVTRKRTQAIQLLWAGRFIGWKRPEQAFVVAQQLRNRGIPFQLTMIGDGPRLGEIKQMTAGHGLRDVVHFTGALTPSQVRDFMERSSIFLFTSDRQEGWGAVLNEAMNSGCSVVASHAIGSVPFLIKHRENGLVYNSDNVNDLVEKVILLAQDVALREKLATQAYATIVDTWNAEVASSRLVELSSALMVGKVVRFPDGPCSTADVIPDDWFGTM